MFKRLIIFVCILVLFSAMAFPCAAVNIPPEYDVQGKTLDEIVADFMAEYHFTEDTFAMGWYNTGTGETWYLNENQYMVAGSMYKLPLCMNYVRGFADGSFDPNAMTDGYTLSRLIDLSIRYSDNDAARRLQKYYSYDLVTYRKSLANFSDVDQGTLPTEFITNNRMSPHIILDTLKELYANQEFYKQVVDNMLLAHPDMYFKHYQGEYEIAHKYGYYEGALNDCGIIYTPTPFLLVVFTKNTLNSEKAIGDLVSRLTAYSIWLDSEAEKAAEEQARIEAEEKAAAEPEQNAMEEWAEAQLAVQVEAARIAKENAAETAEQTNSIPPQQNTDFCRVCLLFLCLANITIVLLRGNGQTRKKGGGCSEKQDAFLR